MRPLPLRDTDFRNDTPRKGWRALMHQWSKDAQLFLFVFLSLFLFRLLLLLVYRKQISDASNLQDIAIVFLNGARLDVATAASWILPTFLLAIGCLFLGLSRLVSGVRRFVAVLFVVVGVIMYGFDLIFFGKYGDHFNQLIFALFTDDTQAILITIWKEFHPLIVFCFLGVLIWLCIRLIRLWLGKDLHLPLLRFGNINTLFARIGIALAGLVVMLLAMRGGTVQGAPLQVKHVFATNDQFLNRAILNPFLSLRKTLQGYYEINAENGVKKFWPTEDMQSALSAALGPTANHDNTLDIDARLLRQAHGSAATKPKHIFVMLMESYSGWTLLPAYRDNGFSPAGEYLANNGLYFPNFISSTGSTIESLNVLVTGLPEAGIHVNDSANATRMFPSAIAHIFHELGYKTRFFYGGYIGWRRLDVFLPAQGFDEVYGAGNMPGDTARNEWGVHDEYLFNFVEKTVQDDEPSFNFILSTSNHSPYDLDLEKLGFPVKKFKAGVTPGEDGALRSMGHHWYADQQIGKFVQNTEHRLSKPLYVVTGDHAARTRFKFAGDNVFEQLAVPFILYGPEVLKNIQVDTRLAGAHIDIIPSLVELVAPQGFTYHSFSEGLLARTPSDVSFGRDYIIGYNFIAPAENPSQRYALPGSALPATPPDLTNVLAKYNASRAIAWYRAQRGPLVAANGH